MDYQNCMLCPRSCGVDRTAGEKGFCRGPDKAVVAKTMLHYWEEPVLTKTGKSGAVFFSGCTLGCSYCQNRAISRQPAGKEMDSVQLRAEMEKLIGQGAENIDLVTPTHYLPTVAAALKAPIGVPVIYNCGGYEREESVEALQGMVDIYLPDLKYADGMLAKQLSGAEDYFEKATQAIRAMVRQTGPVQWQENRVISGVVIRHLILPGQVENSLKVLDWIGETFTPGQVLVSLMRQYTPMPGLPAPFDRKITRQEYDAVLSWMYLNRLEGFVQESQSASRAYIPEF